MVEPVDDKSRLSGARGDFVASLGRRLQMLRAALRALEAEPSDRDRRNALLRRVHALEAAARVLGFASVAEALGEAERAMARSKQAPRPADLAEVSRVLDVVPSLVGGAQPSLRPPVGALDPGRLSSRPWPLSLLLFGGPELEDLLTSAVARDSIECERADHLDAAAQIARIQGPDLVVLDAETEGARSFLQRLAEDDLTEPVKSIVIGAFAESQEPSELTALGATRVLKKPVSSDTLRHTIEELSQSSLTPRSEQRPLGDLTVSGLCSRIAEEMDKGLTQSAAPGTQATHVAFGEGADVMAAVWATVTRVRELVTLRSQGAIRFEPMGPEGAIPLAPWADRERRSGERGALVARDEIGVSLAGRNIVVADDDPAVTWFLSGLLKTVGAQVIEAYDGTRALELVRERWPDLLISDILMPGLDGFALCRDIKRDVAIRDVPVILLSWKEDLLQRMRELGADADGYLRKEAAASTVVQRTREVMRPRARVEARLSQGGEVRGRLDGLTPRLVLELCCKSTENLRVEFRDAFFSYVLDVRQGRVLSARRTSSAGTQTDGMAVIRSLLGVSAGRFLVVPDSTPCAATLEGDLWDLLTPAIQNARQCQRALSQEPLATLDRIEFDRVELSTYSSVAPRPIQGLLRRLDEAAKPSDLLLSGEVSPELMMHILFDLARRGVVLQVVRAEANMPTFASSAPRSARHDTEAGPNPADSRPPSSVETAMTRADSSEPAESQSQPPAFTFQLSPEAPAVAPRERTRQSSSDSGAALDDAAWFTSALLEEQSQGEQEAATEHAPLLVEDRLGAPPSEMATRTPPAVAASAAEPQAPKDPEPLAPRVHELAGDEISDQTAGAAGNEVAQPTELPLLQTPASGQQLSVLLTRESDDVPSAAPGDVSETPGGMPELLPRAKPIEFPRLAFSDAQKPCEPIQHLEGSTPAEDREQAAKPVRHEYEAPLGSIPPSVEREPSDDALGTETPAALEQPAPAAHDEPSPHQEAVQREAPRDLVGTLKVAGYAVLAMLLSYAGMSALVSWLNEPAQDSVALVQGTQARDGAETQGGPEPLTTSAAEKNPEEPAASTERPSSSISEEPMPVGLALGKDKGVLKIRTPDAHTIYVDGEFAGRGPIRIVPLAPGKHAVKTRFEGTEHDFAAEVKAGRMTLLNIGGKER